MEATQLALPAMVRNGRWTLPYTSRAEWERGEFTLGLTERGAAFTLCFLRNGSSPRRRRLVPYFIFEHLKLGN
jgi:hypothetical protein